MANIYTWAGLATIGATLAAVWGNIRTAGRYLVGLVIGNVSVKDDAGEAVMRYCLSNAKRSPLGIRVFGGWETYLHPKRWRETVGYEGMTSDPMLVRYKRTWIMASLRSHSDKDSSINVGNVEHGNHTVMIRFLRRSFDPEQFVIEAIEAYNHEKRHQDDRTMELKSKSSRSRFNIINTSTIRSAPVAAEGNPHTKGGDESAKMDGHVIEKLISLGVFRLLKWKREDLQLQPEEGQSPFTGYPFPVEVEDAIKELECWLAHEKWFRSKSIPWRRGWLLHGPPGTGKSTLVRALGMSFGLPVYTFDLSPMQNMELISAWETMLSSTPCIALIEDIDTVFNGREYVGGGNPTREQHGFAHAHLTFDCLLNCISGVKATDGVFMVVTTNHLDKVDPALGVPDATGKSSRPGRIDRTIFLGNMAEPQRRTLATHILSDYPELVEETIKLGEGETAAQFQNRCAQVATSKFWKTKT